MRVTPYTLEQLLPHRAPMLLLDDVVDCGRERVDARLRIRSDSLFYNEKLGGVPSWVAIEYMAQTIGVWEGYRKLSANETVKSAFLLSVRDFQAVNTSDTKDLCDVFSKDSVIMVSVSPVVYDEEKRLGVFDCTVSTIGHQWSARINAFSPLEPRQFIEVLNP